MSPLKQRLPLILAALALGVSLAGVSPVGAAVRRVLFAQNSGAVNGIKASKTPAAGRLLPLDKAKQFPASVLPLARGPQGPEGPKGEQGPPGKDGAAGSSGAIPTGFTRLDNGNGGQPVGSGCCVQQTMTLDTGNAKSGLITVDRRSRIIANAGLTMLGGDTGGGVSVHVGCRLALFQGTSQLPFGFQSTVTLVNTTQYVDMPLTGAIDVDPGTYDVRVQCFNQAGGAGTGRFVRGDLTVIAAPL